MVLLSSRLGLSSEIIDVKIFSNHFITPSFKMFSDSFLRISFK